MDLFCLCLVPAKINWLSKCRMVPGYIERWYKRWLRMHRKNGTGLFKRIMRIIKSEKDRRDTDTNYPCLRHGAAYNREVIIPMREAKTHSFHFQVLKAAQNENVFLPLKTFPKTLVEDASGWKHLPLCNPQANWDGLIKNEILSVSSVG